MGSLVAAYTVAWTVLMIYVWTLAKRQRQLRARLDQLQTEQRPTDPFPLDATGAGGAQAGAAAPSAPAHLR